MPTTTRRVCAAVDVPVYVDADTGFGGVNNVRQMVRAFEDAGVAGLFLSDQVFPNRCGYLPGKQVISTEQMLAKVKAALDARRDGDLFIAARTDAAGVTSVEDAIERCQLFMEAGADMAKPMGVDTIPDIKRAMREIPGPHMATLSQAAGPKARSLEDLEAAGVVAATFPSLPLFAAANARAHRRAHAEAEEFALGLPGPGAHARRVLRPCGLEADACARGSLRQGRRGADAEARGGVARCISVFPGASRASTRAFGVGQHEMMRCKDPGSSFFEETGVPARAEPASAALRADPVGARHGTRGSPTAPP